MSRCTVLYIPTGSRGLLAAQLEFRMTRRCDLRELKYGIMVFDQAAQAERLSRDSDLFFQHLKENTSRPSRKQTRLSRRWW